MNEKGYEKDIAFVNKYDSLMSTKYEFSLYFIGLASCLGVHIMYLILFSKCGIKEMAYFNIGSVSFYALMLILVKFINNKSIIVYLSIAEIIAHASAATIFVGWKPDFGMFLLMIIPLLFLMPTRITIVPFIFMFISIGLYGALGFLCHDDRFVIHSLEHDKMGTTLYIINIVIGAFVLFYVTTIYTILNHYTQSKLRAQNEQLLVMATVDPLTQLHNRRAMGDTLSKVSIESQESGEKYVLGIGDIDDFKQVNDTYGHDYGDSVLSAVASIISDNLPQGGYAARWGGEEFLFVLPASNLESGVRFADKIIESIRAYKFNKGDIEFGVTMTFGVSEGHPEDDIDRVLVNADKRLYHGKATGKNHTEFLD
ncbi:MAG: GGDEF domain-containing protein [Eubacterium sp.]|nr:GGDEF domain-containing protein [Eubacterium sp.]